MTGGMGDLVTKATINYLQSLGVEKVKAIADGLKSETARAALQGIVACAGATASGGDCGAGALGGSASVVLNNLLDKAGGKSGKDLSAEEKQARTNLVTSIVAGIAGATGSGADVTTATTGGKIETENNAVFIAPVLVAAGEAIAGGAAFCATRINVCKAGLEAAKGAGAAFAAWLAVQMTRSDPETNDGTTATPNHGPRGGTIIGTPDTGEKGPNIMATPDQGERGPIITATPEEGPKGPTIMATPNDGPKVFEPIFATNAAAGADNAENAVNGLNLNKSLASQQQLSELASGNGINVAGNGTNVPLRDAPRLASEYGGQASEWSKVSSSSYTAADGTQFEIHAYRNAVTGRIVEPKSIPLK
ncbi:hypothetical protein GCM10027419_27490 [Pandoraea terrae]